MITEGLAGKINRRRAAMEVHVGISFFTVLVFFILASYFKVGETFPSELLVARGVVLLQVVWSVVSIYIHWRWIEAHRKEWLLEVYFGEQETLFLLPALFGEFDESDVDGIYDIMEATFGTGKKSQLTPEQVEKIKASLSGYLKESINARKKPCLREYYSYIERNTDAEALLTSRHIIAPGQDLGRLPVANPTATGRASGSGSRQIRACSNG